MSPGVKKGWHADTFWTSIGDLSICQDLSDALSQSTLEELLETLPNFVLGFHSAGWIVGEACIVLKSHDLQSTISSG